MSTATITLMPMSGTLQSVTNQIITYLMQRIQAQIVESFKKLREDIAARTVYVMFEEKLNCNIETDHLQPKNILPLFS